MSLSTRATLFSTHLCTMLTSGLSAPLRNQSIPIEEDKNIQNWVQLSQANLESNIKILSSILKPGVKLGCMLKGFAYGLGVENLLSMLHDKVDVIFALTVGEGLLVREFERKHQLSPKQIILHCPNISSVSDVKKCVENDLEITLSGAAWIKLLADFISAYPDTKKIPIHIFVDTGLNREGFKSTTVEAELALLLKYLNCIEIKSVLTHFSSADIPLGAGHACTLSQLEKYHQAFDYIQKTFAAAIPHKLERCIANSAGTLGFPAAHGDIVRVGVTLNHGIWPSQQTKTFAEEKVWGRPLNIQPVLSLKTKIINIKTFDKDVCIPTHLPDVHDDKSQPLSRDTIVATLPIGFTNGYLTARDSCMKRKPYVLIQGKRCPILLIDDETTDVDITEIPNVKRYTVATLIGKDGDETLAVEQLAAWCELSPYVVLCKISQQILRVVDQVVAPMLKQDEVSGANVVSRDMHFK